MASDLAAGDKDLLTDDSGPTLDEMAVAVSKVTIEDLTPDDRKRVQAKAQEKKLVDQVIDRANLIGIDYFQHREAFLAGFKFHTSRGYRVAMDRFDSWSLRAGVEPVRLSYSEADDFIRSLSTMGLATSSIRRDIAAVSSFYSSMERATEGRVRNAFRGTKQRPPRKGPTTMDLIDAPYPTAAEFELILAACQDPVLKAAIVVMGYRGLRVGALPTLVIRGRKFRTDTKGKLFSGELPLTVIETIKDAGLNTAKPFANIPTRTINAVKTERAQSDSLTANGLAKRFRALTLSLKLAGRIRHIYSVHDLRHYFAMSEYTRSRDLYGVKVLLGHSSVMVTETYLSGLGVLA